MTNQSNILLGTSGKELSAAEQSRMGFMTTIPDENGADIYAEADSHLLAIGDTGSSKTRSMVIPILLSSPNSTVVFDTTGEIYAVTNRYRRQIGHNVIRLNLDDTQSDSFNPLDIFQLPNARLDDDSLTLITQVVGPRSPGRDPFWESSGALFGAGLVSYAGSLQPQLRLLQTVRDILFSDNVGRTLNHLLDLDGRRMSSLAFRALASVAQMPDITQGGVVATTQQQLSFLMAEGAAHSLYHSSFDLNQFVVGQPVTIYLQMSADKLNSHVGIIRVWLVALFRAILSRTSIPKLPTLFLLDEAGQIAFPLLESLVSYCRKYGVRIIQLYQDLNQLKANFPSGWMTLVNNSDLCFLGSRSYLGIRAIEEITGIPASVIRTKAPDEILLCFGGDRFYRAKKLDYLTNAQYAGKFDPNPFYVGNLPSGITR